MEFSSYFSIPLSLIKLFGIRFKVNSPNNQKKWIKFILKKQFHFMMVCLAFLNILYLLQIIMGNNSMELNLLAVCGYTNLDSYVKIFKFYYQADKMDNIFEILYLNFKKTVIKNSFIIKNYKFVKFYLCYVITTALIYMVAPFIITYTRYFKTGEWIASFPIKLWFPFDTSRYYIPCYFIGASMGVSASIFGTSADALLFMILIHVIHQLELIQGEFIVNSRSPKYLRDLVDRHNRILK